MYLISSVKWRLVSLRVLTKTNDKTTEPILIVYRVLEAFSLNATLIFTLIIIIIIITISIFEQSALKGSPLNIGDN